MANRTLSVEDIGNSHHHHGPHPPSFANINELISRIAPFSGLILTIAACVFAVVRLYGVERLFLHHVYAPKVTKGLTEAQKRSFINHHMAAGSKLVLLVVCAYPLLDILIGHGTPHTPYAPGAAATLGDVLVVSSQIFTVMYIFELFYRDAISPISLAHHVGAIVIAQAAVAMSINFDHERDAIPEFLLCFIWGAFDVIAELWPHIAMILYRLQTNNHHLLAFTFKATMILELVGTITETAVVMWLFGSLWSRWSISLKVVTPILHVLFSAAQLWGAWVFYKLWRQQKQKLCVKDNEVEASAQF